WLEGSSAQAAQTSAQARLAAVAYEGAFAATVAPSVIAANRALLAALVATNFLGQNTPAIAATEAQYMEMWFQDGLTMDTYATASQQATALPQHTPAPTTSDGGVSANAAAAAQSAASTPGAGIDSLVTNLGTLLSNVTSTNLPTALTSVLGDVGITGTLPTDLVSALSATGLGSPLLPVQGVYYTTMMASMPAKMLISMGNSMNASQGMMASNQTMLANVSQIVDGKLKALMGGITGQMRSALSGVSAQLASAQRLGGMSIPNGWAHGAPEMARAAPVLPANSISAPTMGTPLPNSPYTQALMGALNGRGVGANAAKTAPVKVETRSPAGG
ncbi:MAG TPA: PPE domain-containing protein, partial [Mycobacterium sp.]|nr:PPE domain-containing protein [Mycobacterium sp.]